MTLQRYINIIAFLLFFRNFFFYIKDVFLDCKKKNVEILVVFSGLCGMCWFPVNLRGYGIDKKMTGKISRSFIHYIYGIIFRG